MGVSAESRSCGSYVWDEQGRRFLDCGGYGVFLLGHCHPRVVEAVVRQVRTNPLSTRLLLNPVLAQAAEDLASVSPAGLDNVLFTTGGAEAVEAAMKLARLNSRTHLVAMHEGFHGKTFGALSATGRPLYRRPFMPLLRDVTHVRFGDVGAVRRVLSELPRAAAVMVEPIPAESGVLLPPPGYLKALRHVCDEHDALLIFDEIQTGLGRTGSWWAAEAEGAVPDMLLCGKALSGGVVPVGALVATREVFEPLSNDPVMHSATFAGAPIAMAAVSAALSTIAEDDLVQRADALGAELYVRLASATDGFRDSVVAGLRARGLLLGLELASPAYVGDFVAEMLGHGVIVSHSLNADNVVRLTPPAVMDVGDLEWLERAVRASLDTLSREAQLSDRA
jgi:putrescine aminotransferase